MVYVGSKSRIAKYICPIIQSYIKNDTKAYIEPFVGGGNVIDKIQSPIKIGLDKNKYLIELLKTVRDNPEYFPIEITETEYNTVKKYRERYSNWYQGYVGFVPTFGSKFFSGYGRTTNTNRNYSLERSKNLLKQQPNLKDIKFIHKDYAEINPNEIENCVIYCDPPYKGTYSYNVKNFDYVFFYNWCIELSKKNTVLVSEYEIENEHFECIWEKSITVSLDYKNTSKKSKKTEKLYIVK